MNDGMKYVATRTIENAREILSDEGKAKILNEPTYGGYASYSGALTFHVKMLIEMLERAMAEGEKN